MLLLLVQTGSITLCTAHPGKGDLPAFPGFTAEEEEYQEKSARAQLGAILNADKTKHRFFSEELLHFADPEFIESPPASPSWRSRRKKKQTKKRQPSAGAASPTSVEEDSESEEAPRDMASMASFWAEKE